MNRRGFLRSLGLTALVIPALPLAELGKLARPIPGVNALGKGFNMRAGHIWVAGETLTAADLNAEFDRVYEHIWGQPSNSLR